MAKRQRAAKQSAAKQSAAKQSAAKPVHYAVERVARLYQLVALLGRGPQTRAALTRALRLNVRGFYRDLEVLRKFDIAIALVGSKYTLNGTAADALESLPFPDPDLTVAEARQVARGRTRAHQKLRDQLRRIVTPP